MEIFRFQVKPKHIRKQNVERTCDVAHGVRLQIRRRGKRSNSQ
jgi:hypothetical protein